MAESRLPTYGERELARELAALRREVDELKRSARPAQLGNSSIENGYLLINDAGGNARFVVGRQPDGKFGWGAANGEPPPRPNTPTLTASMSGIVVRWNGTFDDIKPSDFTYVNVHVSPVGAGFIAGESNLVGQLFGAGEMPVGPLDTTQQYWVRLIAYNSSGVASAPSFTAGPITPAEVVAQAVLDGIVGELQLADDAVSRAKIQTAAVGSTEIAENSISTPHLTARSVDAEIIAVAQILAEHIAVDQIDAEHIRALAIQADHIAANAIQAGHVEAGAITADKLAAVLILASKIVAGDPDGWRLELGDAETPILFWNGEETGFAVSRDATTGQSNVFLSGRVEFGNGSQIEQDYINLAKQPSTGFQAPKVRQSRSWVDSGPKTAISPRWPSATQKGSLILIAVFQTAPPGWSAAPNCSTPPGSTLIWSQVNGLNRLTLWMVENSPTSRAVETLTSSHAARWAVGLFEYSGVAASAFDLYDFQTNVGTQAYAGDPTVETAQGAELQFAFFGSPEIGFTDGRNGQWSNPTNGYSKVMEADGAGGQGIAIATRVTSAVGPTRMEITANKSVRWLGMVATFKLALADGQPPQPADGTLRVFARERAGIATPHVIDDTGAVYPMGRGPHCRVRLNAGTPSGADAPGVRIPPSADLWAQGDWAITADPYSMVALGASASYSNITIPVTGLYFVEYRTLWQASTNTANFIVGFITRNGRNPGANSIARDPRRWVPGGNDGSITCASKVLQLNAGDVLYWGNYQNAPGSTDPMIYNNRVGVPTEMAVTYLGAA